MQDARRFPQHLVVPVAGVALKGVIYKHNPWPFAIDQAGISYYDDIVQALDAGLQ